MGKNRRSKLGSYPSTSVIGSMLLALTVLGLFGSFILLSNKVTSEIQQNIQIQVYLNKTVNESQRQQISKTLGAKEYVLRDENNPVITFVSKEDAAAKFIEETGEDFYEFLGENPLRDSYLVNIDYSRDSVPELALIKNDIESISGVFEVDYVESMISSINENITKISLILIGFAVALLIVVIILINNTIKLALFSQRFLIRSMQLVGAKSSFIQKPFLWRSMTHGMLAGLLSASILFGLIYYGGKNLPELTNLFDINTLIILFCGLIVIGGLVGLTGTYFSVRKYLKMSLDELY